MPLSQGILEATMAAGGGIWSSNTTPTVSLGREQVSAGMPAFSATSMKCWASSWEKRFWPNLRTTYGEDFQEDDSSPKLTDSENKNESVALDWDFELFKM